MPPFRLACLAYLGVALPGSTLGLLWPSIAATLGEPLGALGILLVAGVAASVAARAATGRLLAIVPIGPLAGASLLAVAGALAEEAVAPSFAVFAIGSAVFGCGFGVLDAALNAYAAHRLGERRITWMHASYGLGATIGPLVVTGLLELAFGWRGTLAVLALCVASTGALFLVAARGWLLVVPAPAERPGEAPRRQRRPERARVVAALVFAAVETGVESAAGVWAYVFLTVGHGLSRTAAGVAVAAYWATMFAGRAVVGPLAARVGAARVLAVAVPGVAAGAAAMSAWTSTPLAIAGLLVLGFAAAPVFPLLALTTARRAVERATTNVTLQVAASAVGSAAVPAAVGVVMSAAGARSLGTSLLVLSVGMCAVYAALAGVRRSD